MVPHPPGVELGVGGGGTGQRVDDVSPTWGVVGCRFIAQCTAKSASHPSEGCKGGGGRGQCTVGTSPTWGWEEELDDSVLDGASPGGVGRGNAVCGWCLTHLGLSWGGVGVGVGGGQDSVLMMSPPPGVWLEGGRGQCTDGASPTWGWGGGGRGQC